MVPCYLTARARALARVWRRHLRQAAKLAEELSPRIELIDEWTAQLEEQLKGMQRLARDVDRLAYPHRIANC